MFRDVVAVVFDDPDNTLYLIARYDDDDDIVEIEVLGRTLLINGQVFRYFNPGSRSVQDLRNRLMSHFVQPGVIREVFVRLIQEIHQADQMKVKVRMSQKNGNKDRQK